MGHKRYMLVGDVEVPYEHPPQDSLKSTFLYIFMLFLSQNSQFQYGRHEKMPKNQKWEFP